MVNVPWDHDKDEPMGMSKSRKITSSEEDTLRDRIDNAVQAMSETHHSWEARCHAIMAALGFDFGWDKPKQDAEPHTIDNERLRKELERVETALTTLSKPNAYSLEAWSGSMRLARLTLDDLRPYIESVAPKDD